jgi:hypothetical protein
MTQVSGVRKRKIESKSLNLEISCLECDRTPQSVAPLMPLNPMLWSYRVVVHLKYSLYRITDVETALYNR